MFVSNPDTGFVEEVDVVTGEVLGKAIDGSYREVSLSTGAKVFVPASEYKDVQGVRSPHLPYSKEITAVICEELINGENLTDILTKPGFPNANQLSRWRSAFKECDDNILNALQLRAEYYGDEVFRELKNLDPSSATKSETEARKLKIEQYWKRASFDHRKRFQESVKHDHEHTGTVTTKIVLETGIRRRGDEGFIVDETAKLVEKERLRIEKQDQMQTQRAEMIDITPKVSGEILQKDANKVSEEDVNNVLNQGLEKSPKKSKKKDPK